MVRANFAKEVGVAGAMPPPPPVPSILDERKETLQDIDSVRVLDIKINDFFFQLNDL